MTKNSKVIEQAKIRNDRQSIANFFIKFEVMSIAMEACYVYKQVYDTPESLGFNVNLVLSFKNKQR